MTGACVLPAVTAVTRTAAHQARRVPSSWHTSVIRAPDPASLLGAYPALLEMLLPVLGPRATKSAEGPGLWGHRWALEVRHIEERTRKEPRRVSSTHRGSVILRAAVRRGQLAGY